MGRVEAVRGCRGVEAGSARPRLELPGPGVGAAVARPTRLRRTCPAALCGPLSSPEGPAWRPRRPRPGLHRPGAAGGSARTGGQGKEARQPAADAVASKARLVELAD